MTKLEQIEDAVAGLLPSEFERFRRWFEDLQAARLDDRIARDAAAGRLDGLAEVAVEDFEESRSSRIRA